MLSEPVENGHVAVGLSAYGTGGRAPAGSFLFWILVEYTTLRPDVKPLPRRIQEFRAGGSAACLQDGVRTIETECRWGNFTVDRVCAH